MKLGDFTELAHAYINRPAYSQDIINAILNYAKLEKDTIRVADIGAGTGKLTKVLLEMGISVDAVEPNEEMRNEGIIYTKDYDVKWSKGSGEETGLESGKYDWVVMASSFHWTDPTKSLPEFNKLLKADGIFTAIWNPRNIQASKFHSEIEKKIYEIAPNLNRVSSGNNKHTKKWENIFVSTGDFKNVIFMEMDHNEKMSPDRYLGAWRSVNDIRAQAGIDRWNKIYSMLESSVKGMKEIPVPYKMRAWTAKKI
jgi:ubiquinone/menaquinone biosynthesis C-methylase UbiE